MVGSIKDRAALKSESSGVGGRFCARFVRAGVCASGDPTPPVLPLVGDKANVPVLYPPDPEPEPGVCNR